MICFICSWFKPLTIYELGLVAFTEHMGRIQRFVRQKNAVSGGAVQPKALRAVTGAIAELRFRRKGHEYVCDINDIFDIWHMNM